MIDQPKVIQGPDGQNLREQTLAEYCMALPDGHLARRELAELQRRSTEMFRLSRENSELKTHIDTMAVGPIPEISSAAEIPKAEVKIGTKVPCRFCSKPIALGKGYWAKHLLAAHPELNAADSPQLV